MLSSEVEAKGFSKSFSFSDGLNIIVLLALYVGQEALRDGAYAKLKHS